MCGENLCRAGIRAGDSATAECFLQSETHLLVQRFYFVSFALKGVED